MGEGKTEVRYRKADGLGSQVQSGNGLSGLKQRRNFLDFNDSHRSSSDFEVVSIAFNFIGVISVRKLEIEPETQIEERVYETYMAWPRRLPR